jgi:nucleoid-associated protein EbfC
VKDIKQLMEMKKQMDKIQKEMEKITVEADAGKGAVVVTINGLKKLKSVKIAPEMLDPKNQKKLEENIVKAINDASEKVDKEAQKEAMTQLKKSGLNLPGMF